MIEGKRSEQKLKYAKAKAKLEEFAVPIALYPHFPLSSDDLCYDAMHTISTSSDARLSGAEPDLKTVEQLKKAASFYDAASGSIDHRDCKDGFWILASATYFLCENFGSAAVSVSRIRDSYWYGSSCHRMVMLIRYLLASGDPNLLDMPKLIAYMEGQAVEEQEVASEAYALQDSSTAEDHLFGKIIRAIVSIALDYSSRSILPGSSGMKVDDWRSYLSGPNACKMLWHAQRRIAEKGALSGESLFVQLPTGSGKTKSIELLVRSLIISKRGSSVIVIAPLRALCSEIAADLEASLSDVAMVRWSTDVMEIDPWLSELDEGPRILVFTPEKFAYVERHTAGLLSEADLYVFDEAHLIDNPTRGPSYELLIAEVIQKNPKAQIMMLSAVAANPEQIASWAMSKSDAFVSGSDLPRPEKALGFYQAKKRQIVFYDLESGGQPSFFIPLDFRPVKLPLIGNERTHRLFPDLKGTGASNARETAICIADSVVKEGDVAIYVPQRRFMWTFFKRLDELAQHATPLPGLQKRMDAVEAKRICELISAHYGKSHPFSGGISLGILPHYGALQGSIRQSVEYSMKTGKFGCVACTPTLAQGVNLPIKYLIITGAKNGVEEVKTRDFQNLIGRTARSGKYSEGSVLVTDSAISKENGWQEYNRLLNSSLNERCNSALLGIVSDLRVDQSTIIPGSIIVGLILEGISAGGVNKVVSEYFERNYGLEERAISQLMSDRLNALKAVETYIAGFLGASSNEVDVIKMCAGTFAYASADDEAQEQLVKLFSGVCEALQNAGASLTPSVYAKTQAGIEETEKLAQWIASNNGAAFLSNLDNDECVRQLCDAFVKLHDGRSGWLDAAQLGDTALMWIHGKNLELIAKELSSRYVFPPKREPTLDRVEKELHAIVRHSLSNFVSCLADVLQDQLADAESTDAQDKLAQLHRKLKFGVDSQAACLVCEALFEDRMVAMRLCEIIDSPITDNMLDLKRGIHQKEAEVQAYIATLPAFFEHRYRTWMAKQSHNR